jgi:hypothetical protein
MRATAARSLNSMSSISVVDFFCLLRDIFGATLECGLSVGAFGILITHKVEIESRVFHR